VARETLEQQLAFTLSLRDDLDRLAATVHALRAVREQLSARVAPVRGRAGLEPLVAAADAVTAKCDSIEARLHNPKAEIFYDILAMPGGAQLWSRLLPLYSWAGEGDGAPTQGMREVHALLRGELDGLVAEWKAVIETDLPALNSRARELLPDLVTVPGGK
jgi:hypothetical protein